MMVVVYTALVSCLMLYHAGVHSTGIMLKNSVIRETMSFIKWLLSEKCGDSRAITLADTYVFCSFALCTVTPFGDILGEKPLM